MVQHEQFNNLGFFLWTHSKCQQIVSFLRGLWCWLMPRQTVSVSSQCYLCLCFSALIPSRMIWVGLFDAAVTHGAYTTDTTVSSTSTRNLFGWRFIYSVHNVLATWRISNTWIVSNILWIRFFVPLCFVFSYFNMCVFVTPFMCIGQTQWPVNMP